MYLKKISREQIAEIPGLKKDGWSLEDVAKHHQVHRVTINRWLKEILGKAWSDLEGEDGSVDPEPRVGRPRVTDAQKAKALQLRAEGLSAPEVAKATGLSVSSIYNHWARNPRSRLSPQVQQIDLTKAPADPIYEDGDELTIDLRDALRLVANATVKDVLTAFLEKGPRA